MAKKAEKPVEAVAPETEAEFPVSDDESGVRPRLTVEAQAPMPPLGLTRPGQKKHLEAWLEENTPETEPKATETALTGESPSEG